MPSGFLVVGGIDAFFTDVREELQGMENLVIERLQYIGERAVKHARLKGSYTDRTGNLRSSIGYILLKDGKPLAQSKRRIYKGEPHKRVPQKKGDKGADKGDELLNKLSKEFPHGLTLVLCAGMEYASYVEDIHGKDVLTGAKMLAESLMHKLLSKK